MYFEGGSMYFEIYQEKPAGLLNALASFTTGEWRWRLRSESYELIASGESYKNKQDCLHAINLLKGTNRSTPVIQL
jgi:uncharacterized protein YegP (UPF0339 family)